MTAITIWSPRRFRLECFEEQLRQHQILSRQRIGPVSINYHQDLHGPLLHQISHDIQQHLNEPVIHIVLFDDYDLEDGLSVEETIIFFKNLINLTHVFQNVSFVIADFVDHIFTDARHPTREIQHLKSELKKIVSQGKISNIYSDHVGDIDGMFCDEQSNITEAGMAIVVRLIVEDLLDLPVGQF
jgi:hypothetical protein